MKEQAEKALEEILKDALAAKEFILSDLPEVIHQLLWWKGVESAVMMLSFVFAIGALCAIAVRFFRFTQEFSDMNDKIMARFLLACACSIYLIASSLLFSLDWLQIIIAPKVYLIEYVAKLAG